MPSAPHACPVCGDPGAFPIWIDDVPPPTCPHDPAWPRRSLNSICSYQLAVAQRAADLRRLTPDAFDANGVIIPEHAARAWHNYFSRKSS